MTKALSILLISIGTVFTFADGKSERVGDYACSQRGFITQLVTAMNITQQLKMIHGHEGTYVGNVAGNDIVVSKNVVTIPALKMQDGPQGFRGTTTTGGNGLTTAW